MYGYTTTQGGFTWDGLRVLAQKEHEVSRPFTYRSTPACVQPHTWLVLVGQECKEHWVDGVNMPSEESVRRQLRIGRSEDILIGRP
ncbi:hypothetical protein D3C85_1459930 [compost metagenome]